MAKQKERRLFGLMPFRGHIVKMAEADGYVMVRRPFCIPFVITKREWEGAPLYRPTQRPEEP